MLKEHQYCRKLYFVEEGIFRTFYHYNGKDITSWFYPEGHFVTSWHGFLRQEASFEYVEALENSKVYAIEYDAYQQLFKRFPEFERFGRLLIEEQLAFIDSFSQGYMFLPAKKRYELLLAYLPDVELRVKLGHIASFLGISQETLSRIRSQK